MHLFYSLLTHNNILIIRCSDHYYEAAALLDNNSSVAPSQKEGDFMVQPHVVWDVMVEDVDRVDNIALQKVEGEVMERGEILFYFVVAFVIELVIGF